MSDPATCWRVHPTGPLHGEVRIPGSKNAITKHMVAAILADSPSVIDNAPDVGDVALTAEMLHAIGAEVMSEGSRVIVDPGPIASGSVPEAFTGRNRIPILMLGPLLHRHGEAFVPMVGGDDIGGRPIDFHVNALRAFGAEVEVGTGGVSAKAARLHGARVSLPYPSVGATESALLTAVLAEGRTVIENAAIEPEVVEMALFLQRMGARLELQPNRRWVIEGVDRLHGATRRLAGDRLEGFSYLAAGLATGGAVTIRGVDQANLVTGLSALRRMGATLEIDEEGITARAPSGLQAIAVHTDTHPGFMTDWQQPLAVLCTQAAGLSVIHETVFDGRFGYVSCLSEMGAAIELYDQCLGGPACRFHESNYRHSAVISGPSALHGAAIDVPDVRGGFAYLLAAASADSESILTGVHHLERGYHRPLRQFAVLGLDITPDSLPTRE
jgi:UDP-N-acetylglucosamine 1-carboxyvinyltransferase